MAHHHCWALTHVTTDADGAGTQRAHFHCVAPGCPLPDPTFCCPADSYLTALAAHDAGRPGPWPPLVPAPGADPLPQPGTWPPLMPHDPERL